MAVMIHQSLVTEPALHSTSYMIYSPPQRFEFNFEMPVVLILFFMCNLRMLRLLVVLLLLTRSVGSFSPSEQPAAAAELQRSILTGADKAALALIVQGIVLVKSIFFIPPPQRLLHSTRQIVQ